MTVITDSVTKRIVITNGASAQVALAKAWAEGTTPGAVGTKSAKGWSETAQTWAEAAESYSLELLTAHRTYYVRQDGSDGNDGLSDTAGGAFLTINRALDVAYGKINLNGYNVTIQVADGTYTESLYVESPQIGSGRIYLQGDPTTPSNVVINGNGSPCIQMYYGATIFVDGFKLTSSGSRGLYTAWGGHINFDHIEFGLCSIHMRASAGHIWAYGDKEYEITDNATDHINCHLNGVVDIVAANVTLTGSPAFSYYYVATEGGNINAPSCTFTGSGTGTKFLIQSGGSLDLGEENLPVPSVGTDLSHQWSNSGGNLLPNMKWTIADDEAVALNLSKISTGIVRITMHCADGQTQDVPRGSFYARTTSTFIENIDLKLRVDDPANVNVLSTSLGVLSGTTGSDGDFSISAHTNGIIYFENRTGVTRFISITILTA